MTGGRQVPRHKERKVYGVFKPGTLEGKTRKGGTLLLGIRIDVFWSVGEEWGGRGGGGVVFVSAQDRSAKEENSKKGNLHSGPEEERNEKMKSGNAS